MNLTDEESKELTAWARRAVHGLDESEAYIGILNDQPLNTARIEFMLQFAHALLLEKPIVLCVPIGTRIPDKMRMIADHVIEYSLSDLSSLHSGLAQTLTEMGINKQ